MHRRFIYVGWVTTMVFGLNFLNIFRISEGGIPIAKFVKVFTISDAYDFLGSYGRWAKSTPQHFVN